MAALRASARRRSAQGSVFLAIPSLVVVVRKAYARWVGPLGRSSACVRPVHLFVLPYAKNVAVGVARIERARRRDPAPLYNQAAR